jgi:hypothetical protein
LLPALHFCASVRVLACSYSSTPYNMAACDATLSARLCSACACSVLQAEAARFVMLAHSAFLTNLVCCCLHCLPSFPASRGSPHTSSLLASTTWCPASSWWWWEHG